jgi:hypothetical protein
MLYIFGARNVPLAKVAVGILLVVIGIVLQAPGMAVLGSVAIVWGGYSLVAARRRSARSLEKTP